MSELSDRRRLQQAVARVEVTTSLGEQRGTAFLIAERAALTALHVVADRHASVVTPLGPIQLHFPSGSVMATLVAHDRHADWALLQLVDIPTDTDGQALQPLQLLSITEEDLTTGPVQWLSLGFPEARADGLWVSGQVRSTLSQVGGSRAIQLFSEEAAAGRGAPLAGLSGGPVWIDGAVAGLLRWATLDEQGNSVAGSVFACPIDSILPTLREQGIGWPEPRCPYPGIVSFATDQGALFFGRRAEVDWLWENVRRQHLLLVIGASGSGKTSLLQAGLLPRLSGNFLSRLLRPGQGSLPTPDSLEQTLRESSAQRLVLIVDQLEEIFLSSKRPEQQEFFTKVLALTELPTVTVVLVLRADFFPDLLASRLWPIDPALRLEVAPLSGERLVEAIVSPAARHGLRVESSLVERLRSEVSDEPGALPLLQETLVLLWERREGRRLTLAAYDDLARLVEPSLPGTPQLVSGLGAALTLHAEQVLSQLSETELRLCRRTLLRLTQFGEGRPHTRRQQPWTALFSADDVPAQTESLLQRLVRERLITTSIGPGSSPDGKNELGDGKQVVLADLSHEAMLRAWPRLRRWLSELRQAERVRRRLEQQADERLRLASRGGGLLDPVETREAEQFLSSPYVEELGQSEAVRQLVKESHEQIERTEAAAREAAIEKTRQQLLLDRERATGRARWWRTVATMTLLLAGSATGLLLWALRERRWANVREEQAKHWAASESEARKLATEKQRLATLRFLTAQAQVRQDSAPDLAVLLGVAAETLQSGAEAQGMLLQLLQRRAPLTRIVHTDGAPLRSLARSPDGKLLAAGFDDGMLWLFDTKTGQRLRLAWLAHHGCVSALAFDSDGKRLFSAGEDKLVRAFSVEPGESLGQPVGPPLLGHATWVRSLATSPDGRFVASGSDDGTILLWDQKTGELLGPPLREHQRAVMALGYSPDSKLLLSGSDDQTVRLWDAKAARRLQVLTGAQKTVRAVAFVGKLAAAGDWDGHLLLWDTQSGKLQGKPQKGHGLSLSALVATPHGQSLFSASWDGSIRRWQPETGQPFGPPLQPRQGALQALQLSADGQSLWTGTEEGRLLEIQVEERSPLEREAHVLDSELSSITLSQDGTLLAVGGWDKQIELWRTDPDGSSLRRERVLRGHEGSISAVALAPDGQWLASAGFDKTVRLWDLKTGVPRTISSGGELPNALAFSADGQRLFVAGFDFAVRVWDLRSGREAMPALTGHSGAIWGLALSADGQRLCSASQDQSVRMWDARTGQPIGKPLLGHSRAVTACRFLLDGERLISSSEDKTLRLWDLATGKTLGEPLRGHSDRITSLEISRDGQHAASVSEDQTLRLWDLSTQQAIGPGLRGHVRPIPAVTLRPDGKVAYTASLDGTLRAWDLAPASWLRLACRLAGRDLSREERDRFLGDVKLPILCPGEK